MEREPTITMQILHTSRANRNELYATMAAATEALTAVGFDGTWLERVRVAFGELAADFRLQTGAAREVDGTHRRVLQAQPRLSKAVADQVQEQDQLAAAIDELLAYMGGEPVAGVTDVRDRGRVLIARLVRHRQRGTDLLHEADEADLGGEA